MVTRARVFFVLAAALGAAAAAAALQTPASRESGARTPKQYTIEQFTNVEQVRTAGFSADETRLLVSSNRSGTWNVYSLPVTGGELTPITTSTTDATYAVGYFPQDDRILFTRDQGGNELFHLFVRYPDGREQDLTPGERLRAQFMRWSNDFSSFFVSSNERDARFFDIYRYDTATLQRELLFRNDLGLSPMDISQDGMWVALLRPNSLKDTDILLWNAAGGTTQHATPHTGEALHFGATFDPASRQMYYLTDAGSEFAYVSRFDLETGQHEDVERTSWDVTSVHFSPRGTYRFTHVNEDGRVVERVVETATGRPVPLPDMPDGGVVDATVSRSERLMRFTVEGDRAPQDHYILPMDGSAPPLRLTRSLPADIDPADLVDSQVVRFQSFDGLEIPNILYKPHQASPDNKAPAIVFVHGGPGGQTMRDYDGQLQYLVNHGYVVLGINNRGSSGYGKSFLAADDLRHGREPLLDVVEARHFLASLPYVDPDRIGVMGGSYGGYMVLAALAFHPDVFDVGVDIFGVSNWIRTLEVMPLWWEARRQLLFEEIGNPATQRDMLREISPLFHADRIRKPLLVLQGANDPRVIQAESDDIVAAVRKNGVPVEYVVFPDEGHGFTSRTNRMEAGRIILHFLDTHLKGKRTAAPHGNSSGS